MGTSVAFFNLDDDMLLVYIYTKTSSQQVSCAGQQKHKPRQRQRQRRVGGQHHRPGQAPGVFLLSEDLLSA